MSGSWNMEPIDRFDNWFYYNGHVLVGRQTIQF